MEYKDIFSSYTKPFSPIPTSLQHTGKLDGKIECIFFDVYGTLFLSGSGDISIAKKESKEAKDLEKLLVRFGIRKTPETLLKELFTAIKNKHDELKDIGIDYPEVEIDRIWMGVMGIDNVTVARRFALEFELIVNPVYPMPHLNEVLSGCRRQNVLMGIISNAQFYTPLTFQWFLGSALHDLGFHSDIILFSYRFGRAKPSAFLFKLAADKLQEFGIPASASLYVGNDMLNDIYPAKNAGFKTALFAGDSRSLRLRKEDRRCENLSSDIVITDLLQLLDYL